MTFFIFIFTNVLNDYETMFFQHNIYYHYYQSKTRYYIPNVVQVK